MRPIPKEHREQINSNPYYKTCIFASLSCSGKVEIHHSLIYRNRQINEMYAYRPMCKDTHHNYSYAELYAEYLSVKEGLEHLKINYPKYNWQLRLDYLDMKFGTRAMSY